VNEKINNLIQSTKTDISGKWVGIDNLENLVERVVRECIDVVESTPTHCAFTTHDLGTVKCTIEKASDQLYNHFEIKKICRVNK
jgi:hypothetical protein